MKKILILLGIFVTGIVHAQTSTAKENVALETLGSTAGLLIYQTYMVIGTIADGYNAEAYSTETVISLVDEQITSFKSVKQQYQKLFDSGFLTQDVDKIFVKDLIMTMDLLLIEANALKTYVNDKSDINANAFQRARLKAWDNLSALLEIQ